MITKRISNKIYYMYFLLTLMIIALHSIKIEEYINASNLSIDINHMFNILCNTGVATFFFLSALLLYRTQNNEISYIVLITKKIKTIIIPYLLWNIIACPFKILKDYMSSHCIGETFSSVVYKVLVSEWNPVLWFLRVLFIYVLLYPIIKKIVKNKYVFFLTTFLVIIINIYFGPLSGYSSFRYWLPIYLIGAYMATNTKILISIKKLSLINYLLIFVIFVLSIIAAHYNNYCLYFTRIFSPLLFWKICDIFLLNKNPRWIIKQTFFCYCSQLFIANYIFKLWIRVFNNGSLSLLIGMVILPLIIMAILLLIATILNKWFTNVYLILTGNRGIKMKKKKELKDMKICLVGSSGGHLTHLYMLKPLWNDKNRFWVTFNKIDANSILKDEKVYHCYFPTNRNIWNLIRNTFLAIKILHREKPDLIISSGAAVAVPFFYLGKLRGAKTVYIEVFDRINKSTLTGKLVYPVTDKFIVQWDEMKTVYKKSINLGSIF